MKTVFKLITDFFMVVLLTKLIKYIYALIQKLQFNDSLHFFGLNVPNNWSNLTVIIYGILAITSVIFSMYLVFIFRKVISSFSNDSFFSISNKNLLLTIGKRLIFYGFFMLLLKIFLEFNTIENGNSGRILFSAGYKLGYSFANSLVDTIPIFLLSFFVLLIAEILDKGNTLKQENDLTI